MSNSVIAEVFKDEIAAAEEKAEAKGAKNNLLENIRSLMKNLGMPAKQAMDILDVPADEQQKYLALI